MSAESPLIDIGMTNLLATAITTARRARGWSKARLGRELKISAPAVSQWESGATFPEIARLFEVATLLDIDLQTEGMRSLLVERGILLPQGFYTAGGRVYEGDEMGRPLAVPAINPEVVPAAQAPAFGAIQGLARDVPVLGTAVGGQDADFRLNGSETDRAIRPPGLANAKGIFALYVVNDSMYPAWREGALFYVNPTRPPAIGDDVVVEIISTDTGVPGAAFLKRLKARRGDKIIVEQFNPAKDIEFARDSVRLYRVIPWEEALGLT